MNNNIASQVTAKYGRAASFKLVTVTFPPGAAQIVYDPTLGSGSMPQDNAVTNSNGVSGSQSGNQSGSQSGSQTGQDNSALTLIPSILLLALLKLAL